jgi:hypothetical protein
MLGYVADILPNATKFAKQHRACGDHVTPAIGCCADVTRSGGFRVTHKPPLTSLR